MDGRGNATALSYNTLGYVTGKTNPRLEAITVTLADGSTVAVGGLTHANGYREFGAQTGESFYYDRTGHLVGLRDANGQLNTQRWNYGGEQATVAQEWHADGGVKRYGYDVLGNRRVQTDELGRTSESTYDGLNRLVRVDRPVLANGQRSWDTYEYDEQGQRIAASNVLGRSTTDFDSEGNVTRTVSAAGRATVYSATWVQPANGPGYWLKVKTDANGRSASDQVDAHDRLLQHTDLGGHVSNYFYNHAGLLARDGSTVYTYYGNGLLMRMTDEATGIAGYYEYDRNGNRTFEGFTGKDGAWAFQQSVGTYDQLNRLVRVQETEEGTGRHFSVRCGSWVSSAS